MAHKGVVILAATNRPDSLDPALLRPGRFDRRIPVELPDLQGREAILKVHAKKIKIADSVRFQCDRQAQLLVLPAQSLPISSMKQLCVLSVTDGNLSPRQILRKVSRLSLPDTRRRMRVLSDKEKLIVAYHEVGHALVAAKQTDSAPVHKITIIPRTSGALGYTMQVDEQEHYPDDQKRNWRTRSQPLQVVAQQRS